MFLEISIACIVIAVIVATANWILGDLRIYFGLMASPGIDNGNGDGNGLGSGAADGERNLPGAGSGSGSGGSGDGSGSDGSGSDGPGSGGSGSGMITGKLIKVYRDDNIVTRTVLGGIDVSGADGILINSGIVQRTYGPPAPDGPTATEVDLGQDTIISKIVIRNRTNGFLERINGCKLVVTNAAGVVVFRSSTLGGSNATYTFTAPFEPV